MNLQRAASIQAVCDAAGCDPILALALIQEGALDAQRLTAPGNMPARLALLRDAVDKFIAAGKRGRRNNNRR